MIRFEGFGLNWRTGLLVLMVAALLAGTFVVVKPVVTDEGSQVSAAVAPCKPGAWQSRWVQNQDSGVGWSIYQKMKIQWNGCDVKGVSGTMACWSGSVVGIAIENWNCSSYRQYTNTAYGQQLVMRSGWAISPFIAGFPFKTNHLLCAIFNRDGQRVLKENGAFDVVHQGWCGY
jgi:hypothetical protein